MSPELLKKTKYRISNSIFNRQRYSCTLEMKRLPSSVLFYVNNLVEHVSADFRTVFEHGIPEFQRNNDKWGVERQINFIENVVTGYRPTIQLYTTAKLYNDVSLSRCWILDGLQRLTAFSEFIDGKFKILKGR